MCAYATTAAAKMGVPFWAHTAPDLDVYQPLLALLTFSPVVLWSVSHLYIKTKQEFNAGNNWFLKLFIL